MTPVDWKVYRCRGKYSVQNNDWATDDIVVQLASATIEGLTAGTGNPALTFGREAKQKVSQTPPAERQGKVSTSFMTQQRSVDRLNNLLTRTMIGWF